MTRAVLLALLFLAALTVLITIARVARLERETPCRYEYFPCQRAECVTEVAGSCAGYVLRDETCHRCMQYTERP